MSVPRSSRLRLLAVGWALGACGGSVEGERAEPEAQPTFVMDQTSCMASGGDQPTAQSATARLDPSDSLAVVEVMLLDECTGAGGSWIIGRELDGYRTFFLGQHACRLWTTVPPGRFGVVRYRQTAGLRSTPEGACISFDGKGNVTSDRSTSGIVVFDTRAAAEAFATARGWTKSR